MYSATYNKTRRTWQRGKLLRTSKAGPLDRIGPRDEIPFLDMLTRYLSQETVGKFLKSYEETEKPR